MSDYRIEMRRAPGLTEAERRRRMHQAYSILLDAARRKRTTESEQPGQDEVGSDAQPQATETDRREEVQR